MKTSKHIFRVGGFLLALCASLIVCAWCWYHRDLSIYAEGFSEEAFSEVHVGMDEQKVYDILGPPLSTMSVDSLERWIYSESPIVDQSFFLTVIDLARELELVEFDRSSSVVGVHGLSLLEIVHVGMDKKEVLSLLGEPRRRKPASAKILHYSSPSGIGLYRARIIAIDDSRLVSEVTAYDMQD